MAAETATVVALYPTATAGVDETIIQAYLDTAQDLVEDCILAGWTEGYDEDIDTAVELAVCHQAGQWLELGDSHDVGGFQTGTTIKLGEITVVVPTSLAPRARRQLRKHNLLTPYGA